MTELASLTMNLGLEVKCTNIGTPKLDDTGNSDSKMISKNLIFRYAILVYDFKCLLKFLYLLNIQTNHKRHKIS